MKKLKNKMAILITILILVEIISIFLMYKTYNNKEAKLDNVNLKEQINNMKGIAIMLQQIDGTYVESTTNTFPIDMKFNSELSGCIDNLGNKIENSLTYENGIANIETSNTSYCYLYFDEATAVDKILASAGDDLWDSTLEDDGYRFVGTDPNNYICFGTTNTSTCTSDTDKYMYRIIGIFEDLSGEKHLKLIKKEALNTLYVWNVDYQTETGWDASDLYNGIIGSYFLTNTTYNYMQDSIWTNKIKTWNYTATNTKSKENEGIFYYYNTVKTVYLHEMNRSSKAIQTCYNNISTTADCNVGEWKTVTTKIGLMYASDYQLSLGETSLNYTYTNALTLKTGWMHISNNDSGAPSDDEWTMSRSGNNSGFGGSGYQAYFVGSSGVIDKVTVSSSNYSTRPVFYLTSDVKISGEGTSTNPYIITN